MIINWAQVILTSIITLMITLISDFLMDRYFYNKERKLIENSTEGSEK